ncbi:MAG: glycosyltransferase family 2 protein [Bryobacteraceae bacterium]|nr:glycosyltransferase family 2 protein [Bryobacteraceae bacterium]
MDSLSIVIPAYNEERRLGETLDQVLAYLDRNPRRFSEVVAVDDGSRDGTARLIESYSARDNRVRLVSNPGNRGKGYAVRHGLTEARGEWILFTDADLSSPIEELAKLWDAVTRTGAAIAIGSRALDRSLVGVHQPWARETAGRFFNVVMRSVTGLPFRDTQCGFKLFEGKAAKAVGSLQQIEGFGFDVELLFIAKALGFKIVEVPVRWNDVAGTKVSFVRGLRAFLDPFEVRWYGLSGRYRR